MTVLSLHWLLAHSISWYLVLSALDTLILELFLQLAGSRSILHVLEPPPGAANNISSTTIDFTDISSL